MYTLKQDSNSHVLWTCMLVQANAGLRLIYSYENTAANVCSALKQPHATDVEATVCMCIGAARLDWRSLLHCVIDKSGRD